MKTKNVSRYDKKRETMWTRFLKVFLRLEQVKAAL